MEKPFGSTSIGQVIISPRFTRPKAGSIDLRRFASPIADCLQRCPCAKAFKKTRPEVAPLQCLRAVAVAHEHPVVLPHVSHFMQVPFRTSVKLPHSPHISPS